ncbi:MAG TPA: tryptophan synthase subunit beta, partial [Gemmatimonadaceae bacterium]|nr:tryptophan synthase subunit beta [Gemmatimonadaceae bacterium]
DSGRAIYVSVTDDEAVRALGVLSRLEGIIPALETSHAVAWVVQEKERWKSDDAVLICISGRGDKDLAQITEMGLLPA